MIYPSYHSIYNLHFSGRYFVEFFIQQRKSDAIGILYCSIIDFWPAFGARSNTSDVIYYLPNFFCMLQTSNVKRFFLSAKWNIYCLKTYYIKRLCWNRNHCFSIIIRFRSSTEMGIWSRALNRFNSSLLILRGRLQLFCI